MREIVEKLIEKVESYDVNSNEWKIIKEDILSELDVKDSAENQYLWGCIRELTAFMERYMG